MKNGKKINIIRKERNAQGKNKQIKVKKRGVGVKGNSEQRKMSHIRK